MLMLMMVGTYMLIHSDLFGYNNKFRIGNVSIRFYIYIYIYLLLASGSINTTMKIIVKCLTNFDVHVRTHFLAAKIACKTHQDSTKLWRLLLSSIGVCRTAINQRNIRGRRRGHETRFYRRKGSMRIRQGTYIYV